VSSREREGLIARIRQLRRVREPPLERSRSSGALPGEPELGLLQNRVAHLEQLVEGLQDSVHRESLRQSERIGELEARIQPAALGRALSEDARNRGL
jgi:hypothetical protein